MCEKLKTGKSNFASETLNFKCEQKNPCVDIIMTSLTKSQYRTMKKENGNGLNNELI